MSVQEKIDPSQANISRLATYFQMDRGTIRKKIEASGIAPVKTFGQTRYYSIADAARACFGGDGFMEGGPEGDIENYRPSEQKDYWIAKQKELEYKRSIGEFLHQDDVRDTFRELAETLNDKIQSQPDILERDEALTPKEVDRMVQLCDKLSKALYEVFAE